MGWYVRTHCFDLLCDFDFEDVLSKIACVVLHARVQSERVKVIQDIYIFIDVFL